jgi:hypothetical protein
LSGWLSCPLESRDIFAALEITDARFDVVIASSSLFPAVAARGATTAALAAVASAAVMIESVAVTVATAAEATARWQQRWRPPNLQPMAGRMATTILRQSSCSKNWKPYKIETKDIDNQALDGILQLGVGFRLMV